MLPESEIGVGLKLFGEPLPQCLALQRWSAGDLVDVDVPCLAPSLEPALDGLEWETPKRSDTSFLGMPRSMAESTFNLRSFEYAFMDTIFM